MALPMALPVAMLGLALSPAPAHAVRVDYALDFGVERNDNLLLTPDNEIRTTVLRPGLGFAITHDTSTWQAEIAGRGEYLDYGDDRFDSTFEGVLNGRLNWMAIPDRLGFVLEDALSVQPVDTLSPDAPGNRQQVNVVSFGPTLMFDIGPTLRGSAELRYIDSQAEVTEEFNSGRINLAVRAVKELGPTSQLSGNVQLQRVDFDNDVFARDYDRTDAYARYARQLASIDLAVDAGMSRIAYRSGGGDRSEPLVRVQGTWRSGDRHTLTVRASSQFSDTATDALASIEPEAALPEQVPVGEAVVNASPYRERGLDLQYTWSGPRLTTVLAPYYNRLRYVDTADFDQDTRGARGELAWQARPRLSLGVHAAYGRVSYLRTGRDDDTREYGVHVGYAWTRRISSRFSLMRHERDLSVSGADARQDIALLTVSYQNR